MTFESKTMRDVFIEEIYNRMREDKKIFFLCADFGSPKLDKLKKDFKDRFINVGIAEQNLINISTGLALEGFTVYATAIAPFLTMRAYEQIRVNLSLQSQLKPINVNLIGVGAGLSYDVSGPTHHCLEDLAIMRTLPNLMVFSPSDWVLARKFIDLSIDIKRPKYFRFDGKPLPRIYDDTKDIKLKDGFIRLREGRRACLISTGFMTHRALSAAKILEEEGIEIGVIDVFSLQPLNEKKLFEAVKRYASIISVEEAFINKGGLDGLILNMLNKQRSRINFLNMGFSDAYVFDIGDRSYLHKLNKLDGESLIVNIKRNLKKDK